MTLQDRTGVARAETRRDRSAVCAHPTKRGSWRPNPVRNPRGRKKYFFVLLYICKCLFCHSPTPTRPRRSSFSGVQTLRRGERVAAIWVTCTVRISGRSRRNGFDLRRTKTFRARHRVRRPPEARSSIRRALAGSLAEVDATSILDERDSIRRRRRRRRHGRPPRDGSRNARWDAAHRNAGESTLAENARRGGRSGDYTPSWDSGARSWTHSRVTRVPPVRIAGDVVRGGGFQVSARARSRLFAR